MSAAVTVLPMPTFEQAKAFAANRGITTEEQWQEYIDGLTREELFVQVIAQLNSGRYIPAQLED